jgi:hypothetical protein
MDSAKVNASTVQADTPVHPESQSGTLPIANRTETDLTFGAMPTVPRLLLIVADTHPATGVP